MWPRKLWITVAAPCLVVVASRVALLCVLFTGVAPLTVWDLQSYQLVGIWPMRKRQCFLRKGGGVVDSALAPAAFQRGTKGCLQTVPVKECHVICLLALAVLQLLGSHSAAPKTTP